MFISPLCCIPRITGSWVQDKEVNRHRCYCSGSIASPRLDVAVGFNEFRAAADRWSKTFWPQSATCAGAAR